MPPLSLIISPMYFETVLLALEQLLKEESANQVTLGGEGWTTVRERFQPWAAREFLVVNVVYNSGSFDQGKGSQTDQMHDAAYAIDCYASKNAIEEESVIIPGDQRAADALHFLITKVYYTVMSEINRDIGLPAGKIVTPWVTRIEKFVPTESNVPIEGIIAARLTLSMEFKEEPPVATGVPLEVTGIITDTTNDGLVEQDIDQTDVVLLTEDDKVLLTEDGKEIIL